MRMKMRVTAALVAAAVVGSAGVAQAQEVTFSGHTFGCFYTGSIAPSCTLASDVFTNPAMTGSLTYVNSTFTVQSNKADGLLSIGAAAGVPNFNNLGSFTLSGGGVDYTGQKFVLVLDFTAPPGSTANPYTAILKGDLSLSSTGNVVINFDNTDQMFSFDDGTKLSFHVNDLSVNNGPGGRPTVEVTGDGVVVSPEPASMTLLATGLIGIFGAARRRRKSIAA